MAIAGALVVPVNHRVATPLLSRLATVNEVNIEAVGPRGVAVVLEAGIHKLKELSATIRQWDEVLEFELAYLNWEEEERS